MIIDMYRRVIGRGGCIRQQTVNFILENQVCIGRVWFTNKFEVSQCVKCVVELLRLVTSDDIMTSLSVACLGFLIWGTCGMSKF